MTKETNGSAFPTTQYVTGFYPSGHTEGMSLRDYFAAKALPTILGAGGVIDAEYFLENAKLAYEQADAMLEARQ